MMTKTARERLSWFRAFMPLYERAAPLVQRIADLKRFEVGELPVSPDMLAVSRLTLQPILNAVRRMPRPKEKELATIQREFELALLNCIKAAEWAEKYLNPGHRNVDSDVLLGTAINYTVLAHEYIESVSKRLGSPSNSKAPFVT